MLKYYPMIFRGLICFLLFSQTPAPLHQNAFAANDSCSRILHDKADLPSDYQSLLLSLRSPSPYQRAEEFILEIILPLSHHLEQTISSFSHEDLNATERILLEKDPELLNLSPFGLAVVMKFFALNNYIPSPRFLDLWYKAASIKMQSGSVDYLKLKQFFLSLNYLDLKPTLEFLTSWQIAVGKLIDSFTLTELASIIYLFSVMKHKPKQSFFDLWQSAALKTSRESKINPSEISKSIMAIGSLGLAPSSHLLESWRRITFNGLSKLDLNTFVVIMFGYYLLQDKESLKIFLNSKFFTENLEQLTDPRAISQIYLISLYISSVHKVYLPQGAAIEELYKAHQQNYHEAHWRETTIEKKMRVELDNRGEEYIQEHQIIPGIPVDFYLPKKKLVIQVDGPHHFLSDEENSRPHILKPQDLRMNEVLEAMGYSVLRIPYWKIEGGE